ncbi:aspartyl-tRNA(Asn)/glutamyl-tRNA (Gln) amidotransferase subunit A [Candidatus Kinetoplastibacterium blastocrithidii TCC012E]|uniref:Glutamyl-tRNA(Gln) amidotransferase subunit A n=1 Tax=Candidatus Kinetoplastidibacterium blastocrithidiae TCC012E TaxID=1208922 RepID=M1MED5_9PROT|nr:Asp-tRNA(Asn)/Glu-tRNA(Gln) amidotransferase subunit GatA [Candidatus Kinetoplastibacterium blastocrithidii]AFZ83274.1 aspartyl-tRNA(Asn)/glutamyl-tRNA (Gln) amidotransferase subunit A [Candidatus Kinetoplastibacterium blastocrithidii (ex Strigomonas culicis)]AGF50090.1 aspartyl-tRNA(Asn)/glutamyl-tRNA (Gln) amidotransferase subunit A [Candidatus Kinetoplastibacterium blastocrithidii TCC012E]
MTKPLLHTEFEGISSLRKAIVKGDISAVEIAKSCLDRIESLAIINAFLDIRPEVTISQAEKVDKEISNGLIKPLSGIPIAHKDVFVTTDWHTTAASKMLAGYFSPFNATVVEKLRSAGAVSLGKLNCDEFAMGSTNENSAYGPVANPWDYSKVPGGSSGGSAAVIAARMVYAATATDTGGSVRLPSALCGVSGIKPTYGSTSRYGIIAFASSLDQAGIIAKSSKDLLDLLDTMIGFDGKDATCLAKCNNIENQPGKIRTDVKNHITKFNKNNSYPLKGIRIGLPKEFFGDNLSEEVSKSVIKAICDFENLGASIVKISLPLTELTIPTYYVIASAEAYSNLSRFDGIRYGHRTKNYKNIDEMITKSRSEGFGSEVKRRILLGAHVLSSNNYEKFYLKAKSTRKTIAQDLKNSLLNECDVIMGPVSQRTAKNIGDNSSNTLDWLADMYTLGASLAGLPAMSIPCGFDNNNLPIGLQIIGNYFDEGLILALSDCYQNITNWHKQYPKI